LAQACAGAGLTIATGGTDNHLFLIDVRPLGLNGRQAESVLRKCGFTLNRNSLPYDPNGPWYTSGLRLGSAAVTSLGMGEAEMCEIASVIHSVLGRTKPAAIASGKNAGKSSRSRYEIDPGVVEEERKRVKALLDRFPLYPELDLDFLREQFVANA